MAWIVAAVAPGPGELDQSALREFSGLAKTNPAAPWKLETGHLRTGREILEQMTGRSWEEVDLSPEDVQADYDAISKLDRYRQASGATAAVLAFLGVCARHGYGLEGGVGARRMRR